MKHFFKALSLFFSICSLNAQVILTHITEFESYRLTGRIGEKFNITMNLKFGDYSIVGNYLYHKVGNHINLTGNLKGDSIFLYEFDNEYNKTAKFVGTWHKDSITGKWFDLKNKLNYNFKLMYDFYPFRISQPIIGLTRIEYKDKTRIYDLSSHYYGPPINFYFHRTVVKQDYIYFLFSVEAFSNGACNPRGSCGCGVEEKLILLKMDANLNLKNIESRFITSCQFNIDHESASAFDYPDKDYVIKGYNFRDSGNYTLTFSVSNPEKGLVYYVDKKGDSNPK